MLILAIETSCDETSAAIIKDGQEVLSNIISSQIEFHRKYGGIVPEIASRKHIEVINPVIQEALDKADVSFKEIGAVAVTFGPGLIGSLIVGLCAAKAIAYSLDIPLVGVNHLEGHIYANFLKPESRNPKSETNQKLETKNPGFPFICLLVSGGHSMVILVRGHGQHVTLGRTRDDAAGEAFDKIARYLKLGYPGGPIIDKLAKDGNPKAIKFKRPMMEAEFGYDFSFSGLKTGVVNLRTPDSQLPTKDIAASFQEVIVEVLVEKSIRAAKEYNCQTIALAGGVSANSRLRAHLLTRCAEEGLTANIPPFEYCTDNAAMIGCAAYYKINSPVSRLSAPDFSLAPVASLRL